MKTTIRISRTLAIAVAIALPSIAGAATYTGTSGNWGDTTKWTGGVIANGVATRPRSPVGLAD